MRRFHASRRGSAIQPHNYLTLWAKPYGQLYTLSLSAFRILLGLGVERGDHR